MSSNGARTAERRIGRRYVEVVEAAELARHSSRRARNAFVQLSVGGHRHKTRTIANANHPQWDDAANFYIADLENPVLHLTVEEAGVDAASNVAHRALNVAANATNVVTNLVGVSVGPGNVKLGELVLPLNEQNFGDSWRGARVPVSREDAAAPR